MKLTGKDIFLWTPRVLGMVFAAFLSLFVFDVFDPALRWWEVTIAWLIHMVPTVIVVVSLVIAWRRPFVGSVLFFAFGLAFFVMSGGEGWIITIPLLIIGGSFLISWRQQMGEVAGTIILFHVTGVIESTLPGIAIVVGTGIASDSAIAFVLFVRFRRAIAPVA